MEGVGAAESQVGDGSRVGPKELGAKQDWAFPRSGVYVAWEFCIFLKVSQCEINSFHYPLYTLLGMRKLYVRQIR